MSAQSLGATARRCGSGHCGKVQRVAEEEGSKFVGKITNHLREFSYLSLCNYIGPDPSQREGPTMRLKQKSPKIPEYWGKRSRAW
jgi:hypothetical protein